MKVFNKIKNVTLRNWTVYISACTIGYLIPIPSKSYSIKGYLGSVITTSLILYIIDNFPFRIIIQRNNKQDN